MCVLLLTLVNFLILYFFGYKTGISGAKLINLIFCLFSVFFALDLFCNLVVLDGFLVNRFHWISFWILDADFLFVFDRKSSVLIFYDCDNLVSGFDIFI
jgi:NADH:ubiquinone oxidoreductase subunit 5 (subunit L)/multisubunit Na+/H+ antiporter MnhA subunit